MTTLREGCVCLTTAVASLATGADDELVGAAVSAGARRGGGRVVAVLFGHDDEQAGRLAAAER